MLTSGLSAFPGLAALDLILGDDVLIEVGCRRNRRIAEAWRVSQELETASPVFLHFILYVGPLQTSNSQKLALHFRIFPQDPWKVMYTPEHIELKIELLTGEASLQSVCVCVVFLSNRLRNAKLNSSFLK